MGVVADSFYNLFLFQCCVDNQNFYHYANLRVFIGKASQFVFDLTFIHWC